MSDENLRFKRETLAVAVLLFLGSLLVIYPFLDAVILAIATSYILRFIHTKLNDYVENETLSTVIITTAVLGFLSLGLYLFIDNFSSILQGLNSVMGSLQQTTAGTLEILNLPSSFQQNIQVFISSISEKFREGVIGVFVGIPSLMVHMGIYAVTSIYLYKDGKRIEDKITEIIENLPEEERKISKSLIDSIDYIFRGVFVTQFMVAAILGVTAAAGFYFISWLTSPITLIPVWSILIGVTALLPLVANFMVYVPIGLFYLLMGQPIKGGLILYFGVSVLQIMPEIFLRPYIGSRRMDEHPLIIFVGFIAGPLALGLKGIILGPLVLILTKEFITDYATLVSE